MDRYRKKVMILFCKKFYESNSNIVSTDNACNYLFSDHIVRICKYNNIFYNETLFL